MLQMKTVWLAFVFHLRAFLFVCCALGGGFVFVFVFFPVRQWNIFYLECLLKEIIILQKKIMVQDLLLKKI